MTVNAPDRNPLDKLMDVQDKAYKLYRYTARAASNEKVVPKRHRWCNGQALVDAARSICRDIDRANSIRTDGPNVHERWKLQELAVGGCTNLLTEIHLAYYTHRFSTRKLANWISRVEEVTRLLKAWIKSEAKSQ